MKCSIKVFLTFFCTICSVHSFAQSTIVLHFNNTINNELLRLDSGNYTNAAGESFTVNLLQYFISNIKFTTSDGKQYIVPQDSSYFFVQQDNSISQYCTVHVPAGSYTSISFIIGIDSTRCTSKISQRKGVLDPSLNDMYWGWNSGYIFFKMEGFSASAPEDASGLHKFRYHIGGFGGYQSKTINNIKAVELKMPHVLSTSVNHTSVIEINADILKLFNGLKPVSIKQHNAVMFDDFSTTIADNYSLMFSVDEVKN